MINVKSSKGFNKIEKLYAKGVFTSALLYIRVTFATHRSMWVLRARLCPLRFNRQDHRNEQCGLAEPRNLSDIAPAKVCCAAEEIIAADQLSTRAPLYKIDKLPWPLLLIIIFYL